MVICKTNMPPKKNVPDGPKPKRVMTPEPFAAGESVYDYEVN